MAYTKYSLTPANNTAAPPDGAPEGMLPSAVNDTMRDMMAQIRDCGDGIRDGTYTMTAPKITGGTITGSTINNSAIGGTTAAAGAFTTLSATGVTTVQAGTVSLPAITTTGDTNTGIYFPAADTIAFTEGGVESMRIDSSGRVMIGTTSGVAGLTVYNYGSQWTGAGANTYTVPAGNVAIQTSAIGGQDNWIGSTGSYGTSSGSSNILLQVNLNNTSQQAGNYIGSEATSATTAVLTFGRMIGGASTGGNATKSEAMRIDSAGNLGISTTSPSYKLDVNDVARVSGLRQSFQTGLFDVDGALSNYSATNGVYLNGNATGWLRLSGDGTNNSSASIQLNGGSYGESKLIVFSTNNAERMRITSGGYTKMSNTGSYAGSTDAYHEMRSDANNPTVVVTNTNGSFGAQAQQIKITRSSTSGYVFLLCESGGGADTEFNFRGDGNAYADGTFNNNGADYAEYFESATGQTIPVGSTVVLDGNKVRLATASDSVDDVIGVVRPKEPSKASMVVGNTAWNKWANKYLTDDFDRYIMEDHNVVEWEEQILEKEATSVVEAVIDEEGNEITPAIPAQEAVYKTKQHSYESHSIPKEIVVPKDAIIKTHDEKGNKFQHYKLNPEWNSDSEYINRENREEWLIIGLIGQVKVLKEQKMGSRWVKMRDVSASVEEWFIR